MRKIRDAKVKGKRIIVRVDLNCPVENGIITPSARILAHAVTIKELSDRGAMVIVLAHQGRRGNEDFIGLEQHAKYIHKAIGRDVHYVDDVVGENAKNSIKNMREGDILILDNVRHLVCETETCDGCGKIVHELSPVVDYFVLDALSVAHRTHSSVIGFTKKMPSFAGDVLAGEVEAIERVNASRDVTFIFGGSKVKDSFEVMKKWLDNGRAREILVGGALAVLFLYASGKKIASSMEYLEKSGLTDYVKSAKEMLDKHDGKIKLPVDVGVCIDMQRHDVSSDHVVKGEIWDIGEKTIQNYVEVINNSHAIVMNGPLGVYEMEDFSKGTKEVLQAIARCDAFSLLGGGHTIAALDKFDIDKKYFGYVSLSGKALIEYLCGKELPGLKELNENERNFKISR